MTFLESIELIKKYGTCPECGCETLGCGTGSLELDTKAGYFKRVCRCGWSVEVKEGKRHGA